MQEVSGEETGSRASLLDVSNVRVEDGSSLSLVGNLRGIAKLQGLPLVPDIHNPVLLPLLWRVGSLGLQGDIE